MPDGSVPNNNFVGTSNYISSTSVTSLVGEVTRYATISAPTFDLSDVSTTKSDTENYYSTTHTGQQGGYFDGRYLYQSFLKYCYNKTVDANGDYIYSKGVNNINNIVIIVKYDVLLGEVVAVSEQLPLYHAANITYNSDTGYLVIGYGTPDSRIMGYMDPTTMELVGEQFNIGYYTSGFAYNAATDKYVIKQSNNTFLLMDDNFTNAEQIFTGIYEANAYTAQPICCDGDYIYCLYYGTGIDKITGLEDENFTNDAIIVYDWDGNFKAFIEVDFDDEEPEAISVVDGDIYVTTGANSKAYFYKITGLSEGTREIRITE